MKIVDFSTAISTVAGFSVMITSGRDMVELMNAIDHQHNNLVYDYTAIAEWENEGGALR